MNTQQADWVRTLAARLGADVIETHISWVLLAGGDAYKIKKALRLPFLDYSSIALRQHACNEELRLNTRLAPMLYRRVARITGPADAPQIDGAGELLDHAVCMWRFAPGALFCEQLAAGTLDPQAVDRFAVQLGAFHRAAPATPLPFDESAHGRIALAALDGASPAMAADARQRLHAWLRDEAARLVPLRRARHAQGHVREGHGDLHLANIVSLGDGEVAAFDCIEFDPALRCIDVIDDACFASMDFAARGAPGLGWRFLAGWLDDTGEHEGLPLLRFGLVERALVRAQVEQLRAQHAMAAAYARSALGHMAGGLPPRLAITHGLPGSGKTWASLRWLQAQGGIRLRTDVERKRLFSLQALERSAAHGVDLYTAEVTERTYARVLALARIAIEAGWPAIVDGAFLARGEREQARALARELRVPFEIVACEAPDEVLRERLRSRRGDASEADLQVLQRLSRSCEPLQPDERAQVRLAPA